jgi:hypothetical protein
MRVVADTDPDAVDGWMVATCLLDPVLTEEEATAWLEGAPIDEAAAIILPILRLSGLTDSAERDTYLQFRGDRPGDGVRPGGTPRDDGGPPPAGDQ